MYAELTHAGYAGHLTPIDAFWGQRFDTITTSSKLIAEDMQAA